ncbi:MAG: methylmalonyl Co-A mutase-associated GTPase MeaB [Actinomycetales bacterium]|nr:methylmalonyl Co-A mutase-associated GTPase MeaB [Actinomycetales bacterium]
MTTVDQVAALRSGDVRTLARSISIVETQSAQARKLLAAIAPLVADHSPQVIGITGSPGVGKSTITAALVSAYRKEGKRVAVLAVDPSSPFSGGALLGDRIRMQQHANDPGVYIRSMASRGHLGGLAATTPQVIAVLAAAGFDVVLIETVGVGQSEVEVAATADTTIVLLAPGMGDGIQAAKAGILEIGDIFAVNKADRDGAQTTAREVQQMIALGTWPGWRPPVVLTVGNRDDGIDDLLAGIQAHRAWLSQSGEEQQRRLRRVREEILALLASRTVQAAQQREADLNALAQRVLSGGLDAYAAVDELSARLTP